MGLCSFGLGVMHVVCGLMMMLLLFSYPTHSLIVSNIHKRKKSKYLSRLLASCW